MAESHVLSGLAEKRRELAGELNHLKLEMDRVANEAKAIETAIKVFDPEYDLRSLRAKTKRRKNTFFKHGEASRLVQDVLRTAKGTLTMPQIVEQLAAIKGINLKEVDVGALKVRIPVIPIIDSGTI